MTRHVEYEIQVTDPSGQWTGLRGSALYGIDSCTATLEEARAAVNRLRSEPHFKGVEVRIVKVERTLVANDGH